MRNIDSSGAISLVFVGKIDESEANADKTPFPAKF